MPASPPPSRGPRRGGAPARLPAPWLAGALAALAALAGCAGEGLGPGSGGLPRQDAARVSLVVAQTRAQFPDLSGTDIPYRTRKPPEEPAARRAEPALRGRGVSVEPGLQGSGQSRIEATLHLEKARYAGGHLAVTLPGAEQPALWPIVAYDQRGSPRGAFDFTYMLATPAGELRYLVVIGGRYEDGGESFRGFEGSLIEPGPGNDLENWSRAWKLDFGYRHPEVPVYQGKVDQAERLFRDLQRDTGRLERLRDDIAAAQGRLAALRGREPEPADAGAAEQRIAEAETRLEALRNERATLLDAMEGRFVRYYELRRTLSQDYAAFVEGNLYLWADRKRRQEYFDRWKVVEFHHDRIDELVGRYVRARGRDKAGKVLEVRSAAMATVTRNDHWSKNPAKQEQAR